MLRRRPKKAPFLVRKDVFMIGKEYCRLVVWNPNVKTNYVTDPKRVRRILKEQKA